MSDLRTAIFSAPASAVVLGLGGLIPFLALSGIALFAPEAGYEYVLMTLAQYGAIILAFVGALQWAYAATGGERGLQGWVRYGWSVTPALLGWLSLQLPVWTALRMQAAALVLALAMDRALRGPIRAAPWLLPLRTMLTAVGAICLLVASYA